MGQTTSRGVDNDRRLAVRDGHHGTGHIRADDAFGRRLRRKDCVNLHIIAILQKLGAANRAEAVAIALRKHLLKI